MDYTEFKILNDPSVRHHALMHSRHAIDIQYECPKCDTTRVVSWLFPDTDMFYEDECCGVLVHFKGDEKYAC